MWTANQISTCTSIHTKLCSHHLRDGPLCIFLAFALISAIIPALHAQSLPQFPPEFSEAVNAVVGSDPSLTASCPCALRDFPACPMPTATRGVCVVRPCSGWVCDDGDGSETICDITEMIVTIRTGEGDDEFPCQATRMNVASPQWAQEEATGAVEQAFRTLVTAINEIDGAYTNDSYAPFPSVVMERLMIVMTIVKTKAEEMQRYTDSSQQPSVNNSISPQENPFHVYDPLSSEQCAAVCTLIPQGIIAAECTRCYTDVFHRQLNAWYNTNELQNVIAPTGPIQRLPLYEYGLTSMPAYPVISIYSNYATTSPAHIQHSYQFLQNWLNNYSPDAFTVEQGSGQKPMSTGINKALCNVPESPLQRTTGWYGLKNKAPIICALSPEYSPSKTPWASIEQLASASFNNYKCTGDSKEFANKTGHAFFSSAEAAAQGFWDTVSSALWNVLWFRNSSTFSSEDDQYVRDLYGNQWTPDYESMLQNRTLYVYDMTIFDSFDFYPDSDVWTIGTHLLCEKTSRGIIPFAVRLARGTPSGASDTTVYTAAQSETAFIFALFIARSSLTNLGIWVGHVYYTHIQAAGALSYALFNTIDPDKKIRESLDPIRQLLDPFLDPEYGMETDTNLQALSSGLPPTFIKVDAIALLYNSFASGERSPLGTPNTFYNSNPVDMLMRLGMNADQFGGPDWSQYPGAFYHVGLYKYALEYAETFVESYYETDASVGEDPGISAWATWLANPQGANMPVTDSEDGRINTREQLIKVLGYTIYLVSYHSIARLSEFASSNVLNGVRSPMRMLLTEFPDPQGSFTAQDYLNAGPNVEVMLNASMFAYNFVGDSPYTRMVPVNITQNLPFTTGTESQQNAANKATIVFRENFVLWTTQPDPSGGWVRYPPTGGPICDGTYAPHVIEF